MNTRRLNMAVVLVALAACGAMSLSRGVAAAHGDAALDEVLGAVLDQHGFTGRAGQPVEARLGRKVDGKLADLGRLAFRTSPPRNASSQPTCFHNGAFTRLEDAPRFHLDDASGAAAYDPAEAGVNTGLRGPHGPTQPVLDRLDPPLQTPVAPSEEEFQQLLAVARGGLRDPRATPEKLRKLNPQQPAGRQARPPLSVARADTLVAA